MAEQSSTQVLEKVLASAEKLPPFPDVVGKVLPLIQRMAPVNEIETVIKYDQAITAKVLAMSQSPTMLFGSPFARCEMPSFAWGKGSSFKSSLLPVLPGIFVVMAAGTTSARESCGSMRWLLP